MLSITLILTFYSSLLTLDSWLLPLDSSLLTLDNWDGRGSLSCSWSWTEPSFSSPPPLPHMEKFQKLFLWWGLKPTSFFASVDAVYGLEHLATTLAYKYMATVLPNYLLVRRLQRLESLFMYITGENPLSRLCILSPTLHWSYPATTLTLSQTRPWHIQVKVYPSSHAC